MFKLLFDLVDYIEDWFKSGVGFFDFYSGILLLFVIVDIIDFFCGKGNK